MRRDDASLSKTRFITRELLDILRRQFRLDWHGVHGAPHWARVRINGIRLARLNGARLDVIELFAVLHDSQRIDDDYDPDHGERAADLASQLNGRAFQLDSIGLDMLVAACRHHSQGLLEGDVTVRTCWDADRLDLGRVGICPVASRLCTAEARIAPELKGAYRRSVSKGSTG
jgi:uncharacterized protein